MSQSATVDALFELPVEERIALADRLFANVPADWQRSADQAWVEEAEKRSVEMDADESTELTKEQFLAGITDTSL